MTTLHAVLLADIAGTTGMDLDPRSRRALGGGSIGSSFRVDARDGRRCFLKLDDAGHAPLMAAEAEALAVLSGVATVRVPAVLGHGCSAGRAWLLLEYLPLQAGDSRAAASLGTRLARLHRQTAPAFGWRRDNGIGRTPQRNAWCEEWMVFWRDQRLGAQLALAQGKGYSDGLAVRGRRLLELMPELLGDHQPQPSLLHGDLWGGNWAMTADGEPVVFDPASYYGDRETDLAMTRLFGGFPAAFYEAYARTWPLAPGYARRRDVYNLYHVLNHLNLFGPAWLAQALDLMDRILGSPR